MANCSISNRSSRRAKGVSNKTGSLGDVMKESVSAAQTVVRARAEIYGIDAERFEKEDLHIHVPEGATPKDGPSAGVAMVTAIVSAYTQRPVKCQVAMTGEVNLRGEVMPIGGLKGEIAGGPPWWYKDSPDSGRKSS